METFDEAFYLETHPDVAEGVRAGDFQSGMSHYTLVGKARGRVAGPQVDAKWYGNTYPLCAAEIASGLARDPAEHYHRIGRFRGYLPYAKAMRPRNPAATRSAFGGLWTDQGNALDLVEGRLELGKITARQAAQLTHWITHGYVIIPHAVPARILEPALRDMEAAYQGEWPQALFAIHGVGQRGPWAPEALVNPAKALDLHWHSEAIRNLIFAPQILSFLHLIFERRALASQTLGFWRGSQQNAHQDSAYVNYSLPMQFAASWIALEDVHEGAGELFYYRGSHRISEYLYKRQFKGVEEAGRLGHAGDSIKRQIQEQVAQIEIQANNLGLPRETLLARKGDALIWAADLAHGGSPISSDLTRKSLVTHYSPRDAVPSYFEHRPHLLKEHAGKAFYASSHFGGAG